MKKWMIASLGFLFVAVFLIHGKIFAAEHINAEMTSVEEAKVTEATFAGLPEGQVPLDEELKDAEVVDADA
ncbi:MAG: hypothetical protein ABH891_04510 [Candidatus Omnitrophota bacterium]